jgi:hypothetical protein
MASYKKLIYGVNWVRVHKLPAYPPVLHIFAVGITRTTGWTEAELIPKDEDNPRGEKTFEFRARPNGPLQLMTPITASYTWQDWTELKQVKVITEKNYVVEPVKDETTEPRPVCLKGKLIDTNILHQVLETEEKEKYTIIGDLRNYAVGEEVFVFGTIAEGAFFGQQKAINVAWIGKNEPAMSL